MNLFKDIASLFFPAQCPACGEPLGEGVSGVCTRCRWQVPLTGFCDERDNPIYRSLSEFFPLENASSFFFYVDGSPFRTMIHRMKYQGGWKAGLDMGRWYGSEMKSSGFYDGVDVVVPVPLHFRRLASRGYNQSFYIAKGISESLDRRVENSAVSRCKYNITQTGKTGSERWNNVRDIFKVDKPEKLNGRHVLIVDDVLTTGATIVSCAETILRQTVNTKISIAALAATKELTF